MVVYSYLFSALILSRRDPNAHISRFLICETLEIKFGWDLLCLGHGPDHILLWVFWQFTLRFRDMPIRQIFQDYGVDPQAKTFL